ncbi:cysteine-rich RECEPTOR-like kinase [Rhynchospora pubera]|uniref:Cysteine-rich RECEPTOR-like kinase n=1 Tax=Rhynchospora pubera TaxID=906938 RepID=A0AAV8DNR7_9POAL|nr:cysteine-rich RECEPTOR-like kinase [Rhynchospora pubera]
MPSIELFFIVLFTKLGITLSSIHGNNYYTPEFSNCTCNHTNNINFQFDLNQLFSSLKSSAESSNGFAKSSVNAGTRDQINGLIMCYNDAAQANCSACLNFSTESAIKLCPDSRSATFTYDWCFLRYSDDNFISTLTLDQMPNCINNEFDVSNSSSMHGTVFELLNSLRLEAINSTLLFAYGNMTDPGINHSVYGLVECTKDLSQYDCGSCIKSALENLSGCSRSTRARGARISFMSCYIRYELYPLPLLTFKPLAPGPLPPFNEGSKTKHVGVAAICAPGSFLFIVAAVACLGRVRKTKNIMTRDNVASITGSKEVEETGLESTGVHGHCQVFLLSEIKSATDNFSEKNKLGEGGFGPVYKV